MRFPSGAYIEMATHIRTQTKGCVFSFARHVWVGDILFPSPVFLFRYPLLFRTRYHSDHCVLTTKWYYLVLGVV